MSGDPYDYDPSAPPAPSPRTAPSPQVAPSPGLAPSPARYVYLIGRLRGRQITMEEATELFQIQQQMIARAQVKTPPPPGRLPPPPPAGGTAPIVARPPMSSEDQFWEALPVLAAGAGILAAVFKRAQEGPKERRPDPVPPPSKSSAPKNGSPSARPADGESTSGR